MNLVIKCRWSGDQAAASRLFMNTHSGENGTYGTRILTREKDAYSFPSIKFSVFLLYSKAGFNNSVLIIT